jgi:NAD(P)-dependent dehydrogenase (short-subunit alcohol dehydrogenase family)
MILQDAVAVVTGGTGTMGLEIGAALSSHGATVVKWDLGPASGEVVHCDVRDAASVTAAFAQTVLAYGSPAVLINAAGVSGGRAPWAADASEEDWRFVLSAEEAWRTAFEVHVLGVVNTSREFARISRQTGSGGAIVNITSVCGGSAFNDPALAALSGTKAAANSVTRTAALNFGPLGIRVNAVAPGVMETRVKVPGVSEEAASGRTDPAERAERVKRWTPVGNRLARSADVADAVIALLLSDFVTGQVVVVDGGLSLRSLTKPA